MNEFQMIMRDVLMSFICGVIFVISMVFFTVVLIKNRDKKDEDHYEEDVE